MWREQSDRKSGQRRFLPDQPDSKSGALERFGKSWPAATILRGIFGAVNSRLRLPEPFPWPRPRLSDVRLLKQAGAEVRPLGHLRVVIGVLRQRVGDAFVEQI